MSAENSPNFNQGIANAETRAVDPVSIATIIGAIIGAVTGTAATAATTAMGQLSGQNPAIMGSLVNRTTFSFDPKVECNLPKHGHWGKIPNRIASLYDKIKPYISPNDTLDNALQQKVIYEISSSAEVSEEMRNSAIDTFDLVGDGMGGESLIIYDAYPSPLSGSVAAPVFSLAVYLKKIPGGDYWAGACIDQDKIKGLGDKIKGEGEDLIDYIQSQEGAGSDSCKYSKGTTERVTYTFPFEDLNRTIQVRFASGFEVVFEVTETITV